MSRSGEFEWIARYFAPLAGEGSFGLLDDAAMLKIPENRELVVTQDALLENIHFLPDDPVETIAQKALRVNVSDLVSKGAKPFAFSLALGVPDRWADAHVEAFAAGLAKDCTAYGLALTGGDTYRSPERLCVSVTMFGAVERRAYISRLGARPGDTIFVSGTIGDAALGLLAATGRLNTISPHNASLMNAYRMPSPPLPLTPLISAHVSAAMDISDGLIGDCRKLCAASGVSAVIDRSLVPLSAAVAHCVSEDENRWSAVLSGGDDYQCLCTVSDDQCNAFANNAEAAGVSVTKIGSIIERGRPEVSLVNDGAPVFGEFDSFTHF